MATEAQIKKEVKFFIDSRKKYLKAIKGMNYHLFPELIKTKVGGKPAVIRGIYIKNEGNAFNPKPVHKMEVHVLSPGKKDPTDFDVKKINQAKFDKLAATPGAIGPKKLNATAINNQAKVFTQWLVDGLGGAKKEKPTSAPDAKDLRKVSTYLKDNMKSIKGYYATWTKDNKYMGITLPFKFKPTISKFPQEDFVELHVDFGKGELSTNYDSPKFDGMVGGAKQSIGKFKDAKQLLSLIKKHFTTTKKEKIQQYNNSDTNDWKY